MNFKSVDEAEKAVSATNGFQLDRKHQFIVTLYTDFDKYSSVPDVYVPPEPPAFRPRPDPISWLTDHLGRDQFVLRYGDETEIFWANLNQGEDPQLVYGGEREKQSGKQWTELYVQWSPQGTYLATFHAQGIKLWGGPTFEPHGRFNHPQVEAMDFSPCENYLVTYRFDQNPVNNPLESLIIWDIKNSVKLRCFEFKNPLEPKFQVMTTISEEKAGKRTERIVRGRVVEYLPEYLCFTIAEGNITHEKIPADKVTPLQDPNRLKWSSDGHYLARMGCDTILVYELPSMTLLDKKSIAAKDVTEFVWSPKSNMISYWSPAAGNHPALINIIQLPERKDICSRKLFDVLDGHMVWQSEGDYLCVHMTKITGKKKNFVLMIFRVREPEVPVELLELADPILHMSWEPSGERFAVVHGEPRKATVSFYSTAGLSGKGQADSAKGVVAAAGKPKKEVVSLFSLPEKQCNDVIWSPAGGIAALAFFAPDACLFDLHDIDNNVSLASRRHDRCNRLVWDPSGRVIASCTLTAIRSTAFRAIADDGYNLYTFQGAPLCQIRKERLYQFQWRPRPKDVLSSEEKKKIIKNLRKYEKIFDKEDSIRREQLDSAVLEVRRKQAAEFLAIVRKRKEEVAKYKEQRIALRDGYDSDDDAHFEVDIQVTILREINIMTDVSYRILYV